MKTVQALILTLAITSSTIFASCQAKSAQVQCLSNQETRRETMNAIANDSMMSQEMFGSMMKSKNGMMVMQQHQMMNAGNYGSMVNMLKHNPGMRQNMMSAMMETAKGDTSLMSGMIRTMMGNQQMRGMMQNMTGNNMMNNMGGMHRDNH